MKDKTFGSNGGDGFNSSHFLRSKMKAMFGMDVRSLALFRVGMAIGTLGDLIERSFDLAAHYSDEGIFPRALLFESYLNQYTVMIHGMNGTVLFTAFIFILHAICALFLLVGYRTKLFTVLCWLFIVSLQSRNPFLNHGGDLYFRILFFYAMFLPLGGCWSVDSALSEATTKSKSNRNPRILTGGTAALIAQIALMYLVSTAHKTGSEWRVDFTATWYALQLDYYRTTIAEILMVFPKFLEFLTWAVFKWEFFGSFFLFCPVFTDSLRLVGAIGFFLMHLGFIACLRLGFFFWVCTIAMLPMLPPFVWEYFSAKVRSKSRQKQPTDIQIQFDDNSKFSKSLAYIIATFLVIPLSQLTPFQNSLEDGENRSPKRDMIWLYAENSSGKICTNFQAIKMAYEHAPAAILFYPFALILHYTSKILPKFLLRAITNFATKTIGNQHVRSLATTVRVKDHQIQNNHHFRVKPPVKLGHMFVMLVVLYCLSWNMGNLNSPYHLPSNYNWIGLMLHVDQFWGMFSPHPPKAHWYYVFHGELDDGTEVEVFKNRGLFTWEINKSVSFEKDDPYPPDFKNHRWYKFFEMGFNGDQLDNVRLNFGRWVCREFNARHSGAERLYHYKVYFMLEWQSLYGGRNAPSKQVLWDHICYNK